MMISLFLVYVLHGQVRGSKYDRDQNLAYNLAYVHIACSVVRLGKHILVRALNAQLLMIEPRNLLVMR
ncbi:hypothetical protein A2Z56_04185 [Candidatus Kaiserbacteria bacterium RIFCSPHIGHO2_12_45_16]|nr:MAG: hypothetical protein A2Z56_04185 [Candidatus Kaiserbacteria bacterium RIFCSPHIGHO2_12_45_16]